MNPVQHTVNKTTTMTTMQQEGDTSTLQGFKHHQNNTYGTQGQGHQTREKWGHIQIQVPTYELS